MLALSNRQTGDVVTVAHDDLLVSIHLENGRRDTFEEQPTCSPARTENESVLEDDAATVGF
jgi:hypothetical protein